MRKHKVAVAGLGGRGTVHLDGFLRNAGRYEVVAVCDVNEETLRRAVEEYGVSGTYTDAGKMLAETKPDVFCFATQPDVRLALVELCVEHGVKALAFEKPMATSLREAWAITELCRKHGIKAVVSHQQKYLTSMAKMKEIVDEGDIGAVTKIHATCRARMSQLGTHFMDYILWVNGGVRGSCVVGHIHGKSKLDDSHPACDYIMGQVLFENGVRAFIECGCFSPAHMDPDRYWVDNRLTVYGTHGYAWADTDGRWGAFTRSSGGEVIEEAGDPWHRQEKERLQVLYLRDLADWLDDDDKVHPCNVELAYHGYEILEGMCLSALDNNRVELPLTNPAASSDILERMRKELPEIPPPEGWRPPGGF